MIYQPGFPLILWLFLHRLKTTLGEPKNRWLDEKPTQRVFESVVLHPSCFNCMIPTPWIFQSFQIIAEVAQPTYNVFVFPFLILPPCLLREIQGYFLAEQPLEYHLRDSSNQRSGPKPSIRQHWDLLQQRNPSTPLGCNHFPPGQGKARLLHRSRFVLGVRKQRWAAFIWAARCHLFDKMPEVQHPTNRSNRLEDFTTTVDGNSASRLLARYSHYIQRPGTS